MAKQKEDKVVVSPQVNQEETESASKAQTPPESQDNNPSVTPEEETPKWVRVICDGVLGPKRLQKDEITDDPQYVAILKVKGQKKVEEVK